MADQKITQLTELTTLEEADLFPVVDDPSGTPVTKKTILNALLNRHLFTQSVINGNFDVWQRGTTVAMTAADAYTADRWYCQTATAGTDKTVSRQDGTGVNGSYYCARVAMIGDVDELLTFSQALETQDSIKFRGRKLTLSFYARGGAEFVADNATLVSKIVTGKGTDQKVLSFTTSADAVSQNNTLTTSWVKFTCTTSAVIASDITQVGISFSFTHAGAGVTTNYFEVTQVQLSVGTTTLPFQPKNYADELLSCRRYYYKPHFEDTGTSVLNFGVGQVYDSTHSLIWIPFQVDLRTTSYSLETSTVGLLATTGSTFTDIELTAISLASSRYGVSGALLDCTVAAGLTAGDASALVRDQDVAGYIAFNAEF